MGGGDELVLDPAPSHLEHETLDSPNDEGYDDIPESFRCPVCLDLLYKPVVLACGHTSCFWCVHKGMSSVQESHCALCRCPYNHFPGICQLLHFLLLKIYPEAYKRREKQVLEEEKEVDCFSPQFDEQCDGEGKTNSCTIVKPSDCGTCHHNVATVPEKNYLGNFKVGDSFPEVLENGTCNRASVSDVLCTACKQLLVRPVVLNCGHVYCKSCLVNPQNDMIRCQLCQSKHPGGFPKVCLVLDHFIEEKFCEEYTKRKEIVQLGQPKFQNGSPSSACATQVEEQGTKSSWRNDPSWLEENWSKVHIGVGCDSCGTLGIQIQFICREHFASWIWGLECLKQITISEKGKKGKLYKGNNEKLQHARKNQQKQTNTETTKTKAETEPLGEANRDSSQNTPRGSLIVPVFVSFLFLLMNSIFIKSYTINHKVSNHPHNHPCRAGNLL